MKLVDFSEFQPILNLKRKMGLAEDQVGAFEPNSAWVPLTPSENAKLRRSGIEVDPNEIRFLPDGTLAYRNKRVLVYIRDITFFKETDRLPKFHIAHCSTLDDMMQKGKFEKYVVSVRTDGIFEIRKRFNDYKPETIKLDVCKNCLRKLNFNNFRNDKLAAFQKFSLDDFFTRYSCSPLQVLPRQNNISAPLNEYPEDWNTQSRNYRELIKWKCERCGRDFSQKGKRKFLDTHHKNGNVYQCRQGNLKALCIKCHSEEHDHGHMKDSPRYKEFKNLGLG
ncbi:hypothetical protein ACTRW9_13165 [Nitrospina sp. 32_T5]|uniref:hypothetical protein n=1 Tax=unclassified Nitrospina TaxID=2638683 RepID=UPI003F9AABD4